MAKELSKRTLTVEIRNWKFGLMLFSRISNFQFQAVNGYRLWALGFSGLSELGNSSINRGRGDFSRPHREVKTPPCPDPDKPETRKGSRLIVF